MDYTDTNFSNFIQLLETNLFKDLYYETYMPLKNWHKEGWKSS